MNVAQPIQVPDLFLESTFSLGLTFAIENYPGAVPKMDVGKQLQLAQRAEQLGFAALWVRDVPLLDPSFGDAGHVFDPWTWLGAVAAVTRSIKLATGSIILPLHHPIDVAKAAASLDSISRGRLWLGVASGDRPVEYPAYGVDPSARSERFREAVTWLRALWQEPAPRIQGQFGNLLGGSLIPQPQSGKVPLLITGGSRQSPQWIAENADGCITYPRDLNEQKLVASEWRARTSAVAPGLYKPVIQSLYVDLQDDPKAPKKPIHLGFRLGRDALINHLIELRDAGIGHVFFNLKYSQRPASDVMEEIGAEVLPTVTVF